jgi:SAM-dependent methyltransferase/uncharacterized protein YbaR (Trm112 family)
MRLARSAIAVTAITALGAAVAAYATARGRRSGSGLADRGSVGPAPDTVGLLACPHCHGALDWAALAHEWRCPACPRSFPVRDGIVHFVEPQELGPLDRRFAHLYDWFSWIYPAFSRSGFALIGMSEGQGRRQVLDRLDPRGGRVLEVSIGPGSNLPYLVDRPDVREVHGLDISIGQLRRCRALVHRRGWHVPLYLANAETLPFQEDTFDAVLHIGGINFFDDKARALAEMARVAKPGTRVVVVDENERAARSYERTLPGFRATFRQGRPQVSAPLADVPHGMRDVTVTDIWRGWFYCLEFVTPDVGSHDVPDFLEGAHAQ